MILKVIYIFLLMFGIALTFAESLQNNDVKKGDLIIQSDKLSLNQNTKYSHFFGKVVVSQDDLLIHADDLLAHQDEKGEKYITLKGNPTDFKQLDKDGNWIFGKSDTMFYDTKSKILVLTGHAKVTKNGDIVIGQQIKYNTVTKIYDVSSLNTSSRVTVVLQDHDS
jgi:lipopolysaccharide export system protein LptA